MYYVILKSLWRRYVAERSDGENSSAQGTAVLSPDGIKSGQYNQQQMQAGTSPSRVIGWTLVGRSDG